MIVGYYEFWLMITTILKNDIEFMDFEVKDSVIIKWYEYLQKKGVVNDFRYMINFSYQALHNYKNHGFIVD